MRSRRRSRTPSIGMDPQAGFTTPDLAEAETNRAFLAHARRVVVVADHTKWRTIGLSAFGPLAAADVLVTDDGIEPEARGVHGDAVGKHPGTPGKRRDTGRKDGR